MSPASDPFPNAKDRIFMNAILNQFLRLQQRSTCYLSESPSPREHLRLYPRGEDNVRWALGAKVALLLLLLITPLGSLQAAVREVGAIGLTVGDLDRELDFFTKVLPFDLVSKMATAAGAADDLYGLRN